MKLHELNTAENKRQLLTGCTDLFLEIKNIAEANNIAFEVFGPPAISLLDIVDYGVINPVSGRRGFGSRISVGRSSKNIQEIFSDHLAVRNQE